MKMPQKLFILNLKKKKQKETKNAEHFFLHKFSGNLGLVPKGNLRCELMKYCQICNHELKGLELRLSYRAWLRRAGLLKVW